MAASTPDLHDTPDRHAAPAAAAAALPGHLRSVTYHGLAPGPRGQQTGRDGATYDVWALPLPDDYAANSASIARQQLIKGGRRLAALLQAIWPAPG